MKNDLSCGVVRDLLPSYVENLLGEESKEAVERHLAGCPECAARREAMAAPPGAAEAGETAKEVDYLKRVKKGTARKIALAVVCTALAIAGGFLAKEFVIGRTPDPEHISIELAQVDEYNNLTLLADTYWGAYELRGLKSVTKDGVLTYTAREVRVNLFQALFMRTKIGDIEGYVKQVPLSIPLDGLTEVWICGRLVWQDGMVISKECLDLLSAKTPYCGDASALGKITQRLGLPDRLSGYTTELQTSRRPYRWTLEFEERLEGRQINLITACDFLFLALVDNLDEAMFTHPYPADAAGPGGSALSGMTAEIANSVSLPALAEEYNAAHGTNWRAKPSIKHYADTPADFQRLMDLLESFYKVNF